MPKSKTRKRSKSGAARKLDWGASERKGSRGINIVLGAVALTVVVAGGLYWWRTTAVEATFLALAAEGQPALEKVERFPNLGRKHLDPGQTHRYQTTFPTSGPHDLVWTRPGFYDQPQKPTLLVHALEHGNIVVYYDQPGDAALATLKDWTEIYGGQWDGLVVTPDPSLGQGVVLAAWRKLLVLDRFEAAAGAAFIDAHRGRGPEHPVR